MAKVSKTLEYRRARFLSEEQNLEKLLRQAWSKFETQADRTVVLKDERSISGARSDDLQDNGFAIHCVRFTDGQAVGVVPKTPAENVTIGERPPQKNENYLNSDFFALVHDNHVVCLNCGRNAGSLRIYLQELFKASEFDDASMQFELIRIGNANKIAAIKVHGVKSVQLDVGISDAADAALNEAADVQLGFVDTIIKNLGETIQAIASKDATIGNLRQAEKATIRLAITVPKGDIKVAKDGADQFANEIVDDEAAEDFVITLRDNNTIKADEMSIKKPIRLETFANSVSISEAWAEMATYMSELRESGQLEI